MSNAAIEEMVTDLNGTSRDNLAPYVKDFNQTVNDLVATRNNILQESRLEATRVKNFADNNPTEFKNVNNLVYAAARLGVDPTNYNGDLSLAKELSQHYEKLTPEAKEQYNNIMGVL